MFVIICTGYNCEQYVTECVNSVLVQTHNDWKLIMINDGSTDNTAALLTEINNKNFDNIICENYTDNKGAAYRRYNAIHTYSENSEDVICLLGMDDTLMPGCLEIIENKYKDDVWMTYGNWIDNNGYKLPEGFLYYNDEFHNDRSYRKDKFRATSLNTFKKFLYSKLTPEDFQFNGQWIKATTESNLMFSCLEMCGKEKIGVIEDTIYLYNRRADSAVKRLGQEYQSEILKDVLNKEKKELYVKSREESLGTGYRKSEYKAKGV